MVDLLVESTLTMISENRKRNPINWNEINRYLTFLCGCLVTGCVMKVLSEVKGVDSPAINGCTCIAAAGCSCKCPAGCSGTATIFWRGTPQGRYQEPGWCCISDCLIDNLESRSLQRDYSHLCMYFTSRIRIFTHFDERNTIWTSSRRSWGKCLLWKVNQEPDTLFQGPEMKN